MKVCVRYGQLQCNGSAFSSREMPNRVLLSCCIRLCTGYGGPYSHTNVEVDTNRLSVDWCCLVFGSARWLRHRTSHSLRCLLRAYCCFSTWSSFPWALFAVCFAIFFYGFSVLKRRIKFHPHAERRTVRRFERNEKSKPRQQRWGRKSVSERGRKGETKPKEEILF